MSIETPAHFIHKTSIEPFDVKEFETTHDTLSDSLKNLPETLRPRVEKAVNACEFEYSPEVEQAIQGYYSDHYKAAMIIEKAIEGEAVGLDILVDDESGLGSFKMSESLSKIVAESDRYKQFGLINDFIEGELFAEVAVGQTTIDEQETALVSRIGQQMIQQAAIEKLYIPHPLSEQSLRDKRQRRVDEFWGDSRAAGQLEFHNTPFADKAASENFKLRTRSNQLKHKGEYNAVTVASDGHSQSLHFSEKFMTDGYKKVQLGKQVEDVTIGGTIAVPLAEVIKQLPYARGGEYGVLALKSGADSKSTVIDDANIYAFGGGENPGSDDSLPSDTGNDRTFYADKYDRQKGEDYELDFGRAMSSATGNTSSLIFLQRDINTAHRQQYQRDGKNIDHRINFGSGEGFPIVKVLDYDYGDQSFSDHSDVMKEGEPFVPPQIAGYSANALGISDPRLTRVATAHYSYREGVGPEQQEKELRKAVRDMQRQSRERPEYKDKVVVMLRAGTMAFRPAS